MTRWALLLVLMITGLRPSGLEATEPPIPLRVLYVGNSKSPRAGHFAEYLRKHFVRVTVADREGFNTSAAQDADVLLLDWSQSDSNLRETAIPFGGPEDWCKPTVLLNSAGLLVAGQWQLIGGAG
jgi:hypothetical protein